MKMTPEEKAAILDRLQAKRSGRSATEAVRMLIEELSAEGFSVSQRTLYDWRLRLARFGMRGLRDGRRVPIAVKLSEFMGDGPLRGPASLKPSERLAIIKQCEEMRRFAKLKGKSATWADLMTLVYTLRDGIAVCRRTLFNWRSRYAAGGINALEDHRGGKPLDRSHDPFLQEAGRQRSSRSAPTMAESYRRAVWAANAHAGWKVHSYRTTCRYLRSVGLSDVRKKQPPIDSPSKGHRRRF